MRVLIACEESQEVCKAFRRLGYEAYSCDLQECSGNHPEWHFKEDVFKVIEREKFDLIIAHPPCTHLAVSGARHFKAKRESGVQQEAIDFFMRLVKVDIPYIAIENPVCIMSSKFRKPNQIIQPYEFGHPEMKKTCLWLKGLPKLVPTNNVYDYMMTLPKQQRERVLWLGSGKSKERSKTFPGIAKAMAEQWGKFVNNPPQTMLKN